MDYEQNYYLCTFSQNVVYTIHRTPVMKHNSKILSQSNQFLKNELYPASDIALYLPSKKLLYMTLM